MDSIAAMMLWLRDQGRSFFFFRVVFAKSPNFSYMEGIKVTGKLYVHHIMSKNNNIKIYRYNKDKYIAYDKDHNVEQPGPKETFKVKLHDPKAFDQIKEILDEHPIPKEDGC